MASEITRLEIKRYITEALMVNPYIEELSDFQFTSTQSGVEVTFYRPHRLQDGHDHNG